MRAPVNDDDIINRALAPQKNGKTSLDKEMMMTLFLSKVMEDEIVFDTDNEKHLQIFIDFSMLARQKIAARDVINDLEYRSCLRFTQQIAQNDVLAEKIDEALRTKHNQLGLDMLNELQAANDFIFKTSAFGRVTNTRHHLSRKPVAV